MHYKHSKNINDVSTLPRRTAWNFTNDDVRAANNTLCMIFHQINECCKYGDQDMITNTVTVAIAASLFCMLVETGMSSVACLMQRIRPSLFTKKDGKDVWSTGFKWPHGVRGKEDDILYLLGGRAHNSKLQDLLVKASQAWVPYLGEGKNGIMYTRLSYFFAAIRHVRNVGSHRSLDLVGMKTVDIGSGSPANLTQVVTHMWLPYNPAAIEYTEAATIHAVTPAFTDGKPHEHKDCGFVKVECKDFMCGILFAAQDVHTRISNMILFFMVDPENGLKI